MSTDFDLDTMCKEGDVCKSKHNSRGMYRFTFNTGGEDKEEYISDGDNTIKL